MIARISQYKSSGITARADSVEISFALSGLVVMPSLFLIPDLTFSVMRAKELRGVASF